MSIISCGHFSFILFFPLIAAILNIGNYEFFKYSGYVDHPIVSCINSNVILSLFFIPFLFRKFVCNKKYDNKNIYKINLKVNIKHPLLITIIFAVLYEIVNILHTIFTIKYSWEKPYFENDYILELCFMHLVYKLFSTKLKYKHHIVSILFILLVGIGYYALEFIFYKQTFILIFTIFKQFIIGFCLVFIEHIMKAKKFSIFKIIFIFGLTGLLIDLIVLLITTKVPCVDSLINEICSATEYEGNIIKQNLLIHKYILKNLEENESKKLFYLDHAKLFYDNLKTLLDIEGSKILVYTSIFSCFSAFSVFFSFLTIKKSSPSWIFFSNIIISLYLKIREFFYDSKGEIYIIIVQLILILFMLFWLLVYTELLELNCCSISDDTENNRSKRSDLDEQRSSTWFNSTIISDADVTVDKSAINNKK